MRKHYSPYIVLGVNKPMYDNIAFIFSPIGMNIFLLILSAVGDIVGSGAAARVQPDPQPAALRYRDATERADHRSEPQHHR